MRGSRVEAEAGAIVSLRSSRSSASFSSAPLRGRHSASLHGIRVSLGGRRSTRCRWRERPRAVPSPIPVPTRMTTTTTKRTMQHRGRFLSAAPWAEHSLPSSSWTDTARSLDLSDFERLSGHHADGGDGSESNGPRRRRPWARLAGVRLRRKKATALYSISFFPWKMEPFGYYSHPEAAAEWVPDTASPRCQICLAAFNLTRRRHHCRLCGQLICNDCSLQRTFLPLTDDRLGRRSRHGLIKTGEPQRTCNACARTLRNMVAQDDHRVKQLSVDVHTTKGGSSPESASLGKLRSQSEDHVTSSAQDPSLTLTFPGRCEEVTARSEELDQVMKARVHSRARGAGTQQYIISSQWLEFWLNYVNADPAEAFDPRSSGRSSSRKRRGAVHGQRPGPIANYALLNFVSGRLVPKDELVRSRGAEHSGDYHVVSREVWLVFLRLYGGGPSIRLEHDQSFPPTTGSDPSSNALIASFSGSDSELMPWRSSRWIVTELDDVITGAIAREAETTAATDLKQPSQRDLQNTAPVPRQPLALGQAQSTTCLSRSTIIGGPSRVTSETSRSALSASCGPGKRPDAAPPVDERSRMSSSLIGVWRKWRQTEDGLDANASTISHVSDDVVLFAPPQQVDNTVVHGNKAISTLGCDDGEDHDIVRDPSPAGAHETMAAVSAFATAAAEARRKSTMSLLRHSSTGSMRFSTRLPAPSA